MWEKHTLRRDKDEFVRLETSSTPICRSERSISLTPVYTARCHSAYANGVRRSVAERLIFTPVHSGILRSRTGVPGC